MALLINTPLTTIEGFTAATSYGRVAVVDRQAGTTLDSEVTLYLSEEAYLAGAQYLNIVGYSFDMQTAYNRDVDGSDILNLAHEYLIVKLGSQGIEAVKLLS
tara:strand:- start:79 stop:384 length:306 start_codon:yes stop_codon:yes gene_type:complete